MTPCFSRGELEASPFFVHSFSTGEAERGKMVTWFSRAAPFNPNSVSAVPTPWPELRLRLRRWKTLPVFLEEDDEDEEEEEDRLKWRKCVRLFLHEGILAKLNVLASLCTLAGSYSKE